MPQPATRREFLLGALTTCVAPRLTPLHPLAPATQAAHDFTRTRDTPQPSQHARKPRVAPPPGSSAAAYDIFDNHWCLAAPGDSGARTLLVLPAQAAAWQPDVISRLPKLPWQWLVADEDGFLWIASKARLLRMDPHRPDSGWNDMTAPLNIHASDSFTAMGPSPRLSIALALQSGVVLEVGGSDGTHVVASQAPGQVHAIVNDDEGQLWLRTSTGWCVRGAAPDAWQRHWEVIARLPGGNHDLAGDQLDGSFYMAAGQTAGWGYPAKPHVFDQVFRLDGRTREWTTPARLAHPRFYNGTTAFAGEIWIVGGNQRDAQGLAHFLREVEIFNPRDEQVRPGPSLPMALEMPVSARLGDRLFVAGGADPAIQTATGPHVFNGPGRLWSIGAGESVWKPEPDAPCAFQAIAGTSLGNKLYLCVPAVGLCVFDARARTWHLVETPVKARSPGIAAYRGEIWVLGGRDIADKTGTMIYSPGQDRWRSGPAIPHEMAWGAAGVLDDTLLLCGGADGRVYNNRTFAYRGAAVR